MTSMHAREDRMTQPGTRVLAAPHGSHRYLNCQGQPQALMDAARKCGKEGVGGRRCPCGRVLPGLRYKGEEGSSPGDEAGMHR